MRYLFFVVCFVMTSSAALAEGNDDSYAVSEDLPKLIVQAREDCAAIRHARGETIFLWHDIDTDYIRVYHRCFTKGGVIKTPKGFHVPGPGLYTSRTCSDKKTDYTTTDGCHPGVQFVDMPPKEQERRGD